MYKVLATPKGQSEDGRFIFMTVVTAVTVVTPKLKMWQNSKTQNIKKKSKIKMWQNSKAQNVKKKIQKLKMLQNSKTQNVTKLKN